ncbi:tektin-3-like isoform X1 [Ostrea edulis]|uniref:tektin-3-like isoform X1 n=1 Tax=Ostrea edulis TaxID=37623 RepID=UPI0020959FBC|nr:tektin-3-like isoform X1 [Ostrea edulis]XP_048763180.1 tektin-3-like isoform X1 [Ostrea edulis]XP_048763181.1 tektin-3-like isoform X1 [Ostrea edulis]XP_056018860.1 tektin-3-like isoform X1 [Ostrea edulis]XP_056018863.1 tektin-3-like isoform X1 [Ostrea edulis]
MEYLGHTQTATYMTGPRLGGSNPQTFLPSISTMQSSYKSYDTYPAPSPLRRSLTTLPWRPSTYYQTAKVNPSSAITRSVPEPFSAKNQLADLDNVKVPPVFAAARNALYTRYTPNDWMSSNQGNYLASDKVRSMAERLRLDTVRLCRETDDKTKRTQSDVGKRLGERLGDIQFWKTEVHHETDNMITEINALQEAKRVLEKALAETENPLHISQECLYHREKRQAIDLVHDNPERELIKEVDIIKRCQEKMRNTVERANVQLGLNRAAQHDLERDSSDKFVAQNLDSQCFGLRNQSRGIAFHNGVHRIDRTVSVPETWAKFSNDNIQRSQSERAASREMRNEIESVLNSCANEMWQEWNSVNVALNQRIQETTDARNRLQTHLSKVLQEIFDMEKNIELLKKAIQDKQAPMQVAQTRLDTRVRRPNVELCRDPVQHRLVEEVGEITGTVDSLQAKLRMAENSLQELLRTKASLEQDLSVKNNSLFIDREKCLGMRKTFPMSPRVVSV